MTNYIDNLSRFLLGVDPQSWPRFLGLKATKAVLYPGDLSTVTSRADALLLLGENQERAAHMEFQAGYDADILLRIVLYYALASRTLKKPISSFLIPLRREADGPHITGTIRHFDDSGALILEFHYHVIRVWELSAEELFNAGLAVMPLAFAAKIDKVKLPELVKRAEERLNREAAPGAISDFWTTTGLLTGLKYEKGFVLELFKGVRAMRESSFYQMIAEENQAIGEARGEARGEVRGALLGKRASLLRVGSRKLGGPPDPLSKLSIEAIDSPDRLDELIERCLFVSTWQELLKT